MGLSLPKINAPSLTTIRQGVAAVGTQLSASVDQALSHPVRSHAPQVVSSQPHVRSVQADSFTQPGRAPSIPARATPLNALEQMRRNVMPAVDRVLNSPAGVAAKVGFGVYSTVSNAQKLPGQLAQAGEDIHQALTTRDPSAREQAIDSTAAATRTAGLMGRGVHDTVQAVRSAREASPAAAATFERVSRAAQAQRMARLARLGDVAEVADTLGDAAKMARPGLSTALRGPGATMAGRFVTGANVAIAGADIVHAVQVHQSDASWQKKTAATVTAVGSVVAATNVPVVSQVAAVVSTGSNLTETFFLKE